MEEKVEVFKCLVGNTGLKEQAFMGNTQKKFKAIKYLDI